MKDTVMKRAVRLAEVAACADTTPAAITWAIIVGILVAAMSLVGGY